jgi:hypothetical protein
MRKFGIAVLSLIFIASFAQAQKVLDKVAGVVGSGIIYNRISNRPTRNMFSGRAGNPGLKVPVITKPGYPKITGPASGY